MAKDENNDKNYAYITLVAIVAIVALFVMFAGSGSKETPQTMVYQPEIPSGDLVGDARTRISSSSNQRCIDTDGGIVPEVFGVVYYGNERYADECINSNELIEYYCDGDKPSRTIIQCPRNSVCLNGACVEETNPVGSCNGFGDGSLDNPFEIYTCQDLQNIKNDLNAHYEICADIDCSETINWNNGQGFEPIGGQLNSFTGTLEGNDYNIFDLYISRNSPNLGLFGKTSMAMITNVNLINANINAIESHPNIYCGLQNSVGTLVGDSVNTIIQGCSATGIVDATHYCYVGGLAGSVLGQRYVPGTTTLRAIYKSSANVNVIGRGTVGGLVGGFDMGGKIENSFAKGDVTGSSPSDTKVGGLLGYSHNAGTVKNSYSTGNVNGNSQTGGLVGFIYTEYGPSWVIDSYYDSQTSGQSDTGKGIPKTTAQMKQQSTFVGWDFDNIWSISPNINNGYPYLKNFEETSEDQWCDPEWGIVIPEVDPNLCWQKYVSTEQRNHADSLSYCESLSMGGINWDMPTRAELVKLRNYACLNHPNEEDCFWPCDPDGDSNCGWNLEVDLHHYLNGIGFSEFGWGIYWTKPIDYFTYFVFVATGGVDKYWTSDTTLAKMVCVSRN